MKSILLLLSVVILGLDHPVAVPLNARLIATRARDGCRFEHVVFSSEAGAEAPAYDVLIPGSDKKTSTSNP